MTKEFIPYEQALALKELGFDEPCFAYYDKKLYYPYNNSIYGKFCNQPKDVPSCSAPLYQQVFRWFRDKYNIDAWVQPFTAEKSNYELYLPDESYSYFIFKDGVFIADKADLFGPEEAELACLRKLIEIVKGGNK